MQPTTEAQPGDVYEPYRLEAPLGRGGFGAVFRATHQSMGMSVALKLLHAEHTRDAELVTRFVREAQAIASICHPAVVRLIDAGRDVASGVVWIAMELLDGEELRDRIYRSAPVDAETGCGWGADIADAIAAVHEHGIIHRDIKPQNIFLARTDEGERIKLVDFGIAKLVRPEDGRTILTQTGEFFGTPIYMAPEQFRSARDVDVRADIYSLGAVIYETFTKRPPFVANDVPTLISKLLDEEPPPLGELRRDLPRGVGEVVHRAMAKEADARFSSAAEFADALREASARSPRRAKPVSAFGGTMMGAATLDPLAGTSPAAPDGLGETLSEAPSAIPATRVAETPPTPSSRALYLGLVALVVLAAAVAAGFWFG